MKFWKHQNLPHTHFFRHVNLSYWKIIWITTSLFLCMIVSIIFWMSTTTVAQEGNTVSGRLVDTEWNPISDIVIYLYPYKDPDQRNSSGSGDSVQIKTDSKGRFSFSNIHHKAIHLYIDSSSKIGFEIKVLSVEFGEITLYPFRAWHWSSINFALDSGAKMENIVVTAEIRKRTKIRTRVVYADGTPVANAKIYILRKTKSLFRNSKGDRRGGFRTDLDGYIIDYLSVDYPPRYYITLAVEHQGLYAKAVPFILNDDVDIVLKLNGNPGSITKPTEVYAEIYSALETLLAPTPMWIANQTNGHAYKITKPQTIKYSMNQADAEGAYLLSINDEFEQNWLSHIYGTERLWIGLSDVEKEGNWKWHSGEPVNYTNWLPYQPEKGNTETKDYVMTGYFDWGWEVYGEMAGETNFFYVRAILEKPTIQFSSEHD